MFHLDTLATLVAATLTLLLGRKLVHSVSFLKKYTIPEPVAGGLLVALALLILKKSMGWEVNFDMSLRDPLMLAFFATIGLNANLASLRAGGRVVGVFLIVVVGLLVMQNAIGIGMASLLGLDPLMGLLAGSITLSGGHGTGAAWSKLFIERYGFTNATEVAMACATFGLVLGGLIGGPVARYLVKHSTTPNGIPDDQEVPTAFEKPDVGRMITSLVLIETALRRWSWSSKCQYSLFPPPASRSCRRASSGWHYVVPPDQYRDRQPVQWRDPSSFSLSGYRSNAGRPTVQLRRGWLYVWVGHQE